MLPLARLGDNRWVDGYQDASGGNMLKIRTEQMDALDQSTRVDFHQRLVTFLRHELPEATAAFDDTVLLESILESERRAAVYGIESDAGIAQFVCLTFAAGPKFDDLPEVRAYLEEPGLDPEEKLAEPADYLAALENGETTMLDVEDLAALQDEDADQDLQDKTRCLFLG